MRRNMHGVLLSRARKIALAFLVFCFALAPYAAFAGKEGVYISGSSYFTLEKVRFSEGSDDAILRFSVALHNGDSVPIDYNNYGARVTDDSGFSYSAQLTGQQNARVQPGKEQQFAYEARVTKGLKPEQLQVTLFTWNYGTTVSMSDLGSLSVAAAMSETSGTSPEAVVPLKKVDAAFSNDDKVSFRVGNEYFVSENNEWALYTDLIAENAGDNGLTLPAGLKMRLEDSNGQVVSVTTVDGADRSLLPGKPQRITIRAALPSAASTGDWTLQFYYVNGTASTVLESLPVGRTSSVSAIGNARSVADSSGQETVSVQVESAAVTPSEAGQWVSAKVLVSNKGTKVAAIPKLAVKFQTSDGAVSVSSEDTSVHASYLSPSESETFTYNVLLPKGVSVSDMQIALFESRGSATAGTGSNTNANNTNANNANNANTNNANNGNSNNTGTQTKTVPVLVTSLSRAQVNATSGSSDYALGDSLGLTLDKKAEVALTDLHLYDNESNGFKTVVAKFKFTNKDTTVLATPDLAFELVDDSGHIYSGTKQTTVPAQLATNSSYLISYSFLMMSADTEKPMQLRAYNAKDTSRVPLGNVQVSIQDDDVTDMNWGVYPYQLDVKSKELVHSVLSTTFSYTLRLDVDVQRKEQIIADAALSKLQFDLIDALGQVISTQSIAFQGNVKLLNGLNEVTFTNLKINQFSSKNFVNVYETIDTPNGIVKRKVMEIRNW
ncbi:hypothetical protein [Paenibacillus ginsengarvi]|uniref:Uncharacterized protein n=1 Tax=Paenibacillus ginsengarvi TaxID=400777 RepID=A0A3B0CJK5_9BACL|nr:hypothetical protein [Paenibacillus ginsengarvi]RKN84449.1 hypothetical protein D7M11_13280 [Paenibacillus ginsengarvi]